MWGPPDAPSPPPSSGRVTGVWSPASRRRMQLRLASVDWSPVFDTGRAGMLTLTMPGAWLRYAPTGRAWAAAWRRYWERHRRAWGPAPGAWIVEFQTRSTRRAPHAHCVLAIPEGTAWLGRGKGRRQVEYAEWAAHAWSEALGVEDGPGKEAHLRHGVHVQLFGDDGRSGARIAAYFAGYAAGKGYKGQRVPPPEWQEPGCGLPKVWGVRGLAERVVGEALLGADGDAAHVASLRFLRRWHRANHRGRRWPGNSAGVALNLGDRSEAVYRDLARAVEVCGPGHGL
jgi:hypothetical protein